jgi:hypothetical protein
MSKFDHMDMEHHIVFEFALIVVRSLEYFTAAEIEERANQPMDSNDGS